MTIRFARAKTGSTVAATGPISLRRARALRRRCVHRVANDNCPGAAALEANQRILDAALRHFAKHGLDASRAAKTEAKAALDLGDHEAFDHWTGVARTFAAQAPTQVANANQAACAASSDRPNPCISEHD